MPADITRTSIEAHAPGEDLLKYYKSRVDTFENEREELLGRLDNIAVAHEELHKFQWESNKRAEEVKELQKALSDAHTFLFDERERLLALQSENDELKLQEIEDRKRIQHLLALTQPLEHEIKYVRNQGPESMTVYPVPPVQPQESAGAAGTGRVMRTVYLPSSNTDTLMLKVESLQAQLNEQKQFANERIAALLEDRRIREQDELGYREGLERKLEQQGEKLKKTQDLLGATTKDYIVLKRRTHEAEATANEARTELDERKRAMDQELSDTKTEMEAEKEAYKRQVDANAEEYVKTFRDQLKAREQEILKWEALHLATKSNFEKRIEELEKKLVAMTRKYKETEHRRALDMEGWTADVTMLRKRLAAIDRRLHQMRLVDRLEDDERLDALLDQLDERAPPVGFAGVGPGEPPALRIARGGGVGGGGIGPRPATAPAPGRGLRRGHPKPSSRAEAPTVAGQLRDVKAKLREMEARLDAPMRLKLGPS